SAALTMPCANGCSECCSTLAANCNTSFSVVPSTDCIFSTPNSPLVRVPVLSNMTAFTFLACSKLVLLRISNPCFADREVETSLTNGAANRTRWGHAITMTVTILSKLESKGMSTYNQIPNVLQPDASAM